MVFYEQTILHQLIGNKMNKAKVDLNSVKLKQGTLFVVFYARHLLQSARGSLYNSRKSDRTERQGPGVWEKKWKGRILYCVSE